jgi:hypothetical protein
LEPEKSENIESAVTRIAPVQSWNNQRMPGPTTKIEPGEWVRAPKLWPGIWKIHRVLAGFKEHRWSLNEPSVTSSRTIVFCHRLVNDSWKRSLTFNSCEASYLTPLDPIDRQKVDSLLASDKKLADAFVKLQATKNSLDLVANLALGGLNEEAVEHFPNSCNEMLASRIDAGVTLDEVLRLLQQNGLDSYVSKYPIRVTLQLISLNHEVRGNDFVHRKYATLKY